jgi:hypothetical protein
MFKNSLLLFLTFILFTQCSVDRVVSYEDLFKDKAFESPDDLGENFLSELQPKPDTINVNFTATNSSCSLKSINGNGGKSNTNPVVNVINGVQTTAENTVTPIKPFQIVFVDLLKLKDMVLFNKPTMAGDSILTTGGAMYFDMIRDKKSIPVSEIEPIVVLKSKNAVLGMSIYYETKLSDGKKTWEIDPKTKIETLNSDKDSVSYKFQPTKFGWINVDKLYQIPGEKTSITFKSQYLDIKYINIMLAFPSIQSVIRVPSSGVSTQLPVGEKAYLIAISVSKSKEFFVHFEKIEIKKNQTIDLLLKPTTKKELEDVLDKIDN